MATIKEALGVALTSAVAELTAAKVPFALVGGLAMGIRADPRVTRDIDFVMPVKDDSAAEATVFVLQHRGFVVDSVFVREGQRISTVRSRHQSAPDIFIDLLFSNARIEGEIVAAASWETIAHGIQCPVAQPWHLLAMKVFANRKKDQPDLQQLVEQMGASGIKATERALRLMQHRGVAPERHLVNELRALIREVRSSGKLEVRAKGSLLQRILRRNKTQAHRPWG